LNQHWQFSQPHFSHLQLALFFEQQLLVSSLGTVQHDLVEHPQSPGPLHLQGLHEQVAQVQLALVVLFFAEHPQALESHLQSTHEHCSQTHVFFATIVPSHTQLTQVQTTHWQFGLLTVVTTVHPHEVPSHLQSTHLQVAHKQDFFATIGPSHWQLTQVQTTHWQFALFPVVLVEHPQSPTH
jgi:hypothetical protein